MSQDLGKTAEKKCPKCGQNMEAGMTVEYKSPGGWDVNINIPKNETWGTGLTAGFFMDSVNKEIPIVTYRCTSCGFLESYAKSVETLLQP